MLERQIWCENTDLRLSDGYKTHYHQIQTRLYQNPNPNQIDIRDIARNLSFENRFLGQAHGPYSVAQHCALGSELFIAQGKPEFALQFLLHDAAEHI